MTTISYATVGLRKLGLLVTLLLVGWSSGPAQAEDVGARLNTQQIEQMVAPIALYPDALISQVLMASTYPL